MVIDDTYELTQIAPAGDPPEQLELTGAYRAREDFWDPIVFGLDVDAEGRTLVATVTGPKDAPRLVIDRIRRDMTRRETFSVPELAEYVASELPEQPQRVRGIRACGEHSVCFWTDARVGRIDLP